MHLTSLPFYRVLTLWFDYGHWPDVNEALVEGIKTIQIDTWLQVHKMFMTLAVGYIAFINLYLSKITLHFISAHSFLWPRMKML